MRTSKAFINGEEYITCFSTRVLMSIEEKYGDADEGLKKILNGKKIADIFWLLSLMIDAGDRYAKMEGIENPGKMSMDELIDIVGVNDYESIFKAVSATALAGNTATVEVKPQKNAKTTQAK